MNEQTEQAQAFLAHNQTAEASAQALISIAISLERIATALEATRS
ncbi:hypothetical protein [Microbacterium sp. BLY]|nr:hypothetical protein [Microbacterium sp. BLY]